MKDVAKILGIGIVVILIFLVAVACGSSQRSNVVGSNKLSSSIDRFEDTKYKVICWERDYGGLFCMDETKLELR